MMRPDQERVRKLLTEAVTLLCRNSLQFQDEVTVEGLIGITLDKKDIFLVSINESVENTLKLSTKRSCDNECDNTPVISGSPNSKKRRHSQEKRRKSSERRASPVTISPDIQPKIEPRDTVEINDGETKMHAVDIKTEKFDQISYDNNLTSTNFVNNSHDNRLDSVHYDNGSQERNTTSNLEFSKNSSNDQSPLNMDSSEVNIKEESKEEEDSCFVIDSDEDYDASFDDSLSSEQKKIHSNYSLGEGNIIPYQWGNNESNLEYIGNDSSFLDNSSEFPQGHNFNQWQSLDNSQSSSSNMQNEGNSFLPGTSFNSSHDPNQRKVICHLCNKLIDRNTIRRHIKSVHMKLKPFECPICGNRFAHKYNMQRHTYLRHRIDITDSSHAQFLKQENASLMNRQHSDYRNYSFDNMVDEQNSDHQDNVKLSNVKMPAFSELSQDVSSNDES